MQRNGNFKRMLITLILKLNYSNAIAPSNEHLIDGTTINDKVKTPCQICESSKYEIPST